MEASNSKGRCVTTLKAAAGVYSVFFIVSLACFIGVKMVTQNFGIEAPENMGYVNIVKMSLLLPLGLIFVYLLGAAVFFQSPNKLAKRLKESPHESN